MEENNEIPCSSKGTPFTKVLAVVLCEEVDICDLNKTFEEKFGNVCNIEPLKLNYECPETGFYITFEKPEHAELAIQREMTMLLHSDEVVLIFPVHDEHQAIEFNGLILCSSGHCHSLPFPLLAEQNHMEADTSLLQRSSLGETEDQCSSNEKESLPESTDIVGSDDECKITILNDICLRHVFSFLNKKELIKIERVCKWWQSVSLSCWSSFKEIIIRDIIPKKSRVTVKMLKYVLKRCGKYIKILDIIIDDEAHYYGYRAVEYIAKYCSSLRELYMSHVQMCAVSCRILFNTVKQLEILHISNCSGLEDQPLGRLLSRCQNLRDLCVDNIICFPGKCLNSLNPNTMETLTMFNVHNLKIEVCVPALKTMKNLKCLKMDGFTSICSCEVFSSFIESVPNLEHFVYRNTFRRFDINNCNKRFGNLVNLTYLNVCQNQLITDKVLLEIISNCVNIKRLVLSGCGARGATEQETVTDFGVRKLVDLRQLQDLSISCLKYVTDHSLEALALAGRLIKLAICGNHNITDAGCGKIVLLCKDLEHFDISECTNITHSTVMAAEAAVQSRTTDKTLHMIVGGTRVSNTEKWKNASPLLVVNFSDPCKHNARILCDSC